MKAVTMVVERQMANTEARMANDAEISRLLVLILYVQVSY